MVGEKSGRATPDLFLVETGSGGFGQSEFKDE